MRNNGYINKEITGKEKEPRIMFSRKSLLIMALLLAVTFYMTPRYEAEAMDPVTIAILAPIAIQVAKVVAPYIFKGLANMGVFMLKAGKPLLETFLLPCGIFELTLLAPWRWRPGLIHIGQGILGPFKFCGYMLLVPLSPFGIGQNLDL